MTDPELDLLAQVLAAVPPQPATYEEIAVLARVQPQFTYAALTILVGRNEIHHGIAMRPRRSSPALVQRAVYWKRA